MGCGNTLELLAMRIIGCSLCPRLSRYRVEVAKKYSGESFWSKPVPGYGDPMARVFVAGLAPAARGGNRTGRVFTGDETSNNLMRALYDAGYANQPYSISKDDSLILRDIYLTASVKCVPPENRPTKEEILNCSNYLVEEIRILGRARVFIALGRIAWEALKHAIGIALGASIPNYRFYHGAEYMVNTMLRGSVWLIASYHPSPRNMKTGRLSHEMLVSIFRRARELADLYP
ncbi:MAG: uracil-DNA glycosylase [Sulfolobales archaeon]